MRGSHCTLGSLATRVALPIALTLGAWIVPAYAALDEWGTFTEGDTRFCPEGVCDGTFIQQAEDGGLLQASSSVAFVPDDPATSPGNDFAAQATLPAPLGLPELKALAVSPITLSVPPADPGRFISTATAEAVQGYEYVGSAPGEFTLEVLPSGTVTGFGSISGFVGVFDADTFDRLGEFHGTSLAATTFLIELARTIDAEPLVFTLDPGDEFYIWAVLFATADSRDGTPSEADAFHSLNMEFHDASGLIAATAVPEPAGGGLVAWVVAMLLAAARSNQVGMRSAAGS